MKINRKDQQALAALLYENFNAEYSDESSMGSMDDGMDSGNEFDMGDGGMSVDVMQIDPIAPVESFESEENEQVTADLKKLAEYVGRLQELCGQCDVEPWMVAKISKAAEYVSDIYYMLDSSVDFANTGFEQAPPTQSL
jgi:hypothetical protein